MQSMQRLRHLSHDLPSGLVQQRDRSRRIREWFCHVGLHALPLDWFISTNLVTLSMSAYISRRRTCDARTLLLIVQMTEFGHFQDQLDLKPSEGGASFSFERRYHRLNQEVRSGARSQPQEFRHIEQNCVCNDEKDRITHMYVKHILG